MRRLEVLQVCRLLQLVRQGRQDPVLKLLQLGVHGLVNLTEPRDGTAALHVAAGGNHLALLSFLLAQGASPNVQDGEGCTPAMLAARLGHHAALSLLVNQGADLELRDVQGRGILFYCLQPTQHHARCLQVALQNHADVNNVSVEGKPVLLLSCQQGEESSSLSLLEWGADPNATDQTTGVTALMLAAQSASLQLLRSVLQRGGDPNRLDAQRLTAAHYAAMRGHFEVVRVLSAYSADLEVISLEGDTPLHYAAAAGDANCCKFLAQRGCNPKLRNCNNLLPRVIAKASGHKVAVKELKKVEKLMGKAGGPGVAPWAVTLYDWTQEHQAALLDALAEETGSVSVKTLTEVLNNLGAPLDQDQLRTLMKAHDRRREGVVNLTDFLSGTSYVPKAFSMSAYTAKFKKGKKGGRKGKKKGKLLIPMPICTAPPHLHPRREDGGPPHYMIETFQHCTDIRRFDRDHPPRHPIQDDSAWYLNRPDKVYSNINYCVRSGDLESLEQAWRQGVSLDVKDRFYKTPLMAACISGNYHMAQYLVELGADVAACDQFSWTALHHAAHAGRVELLQLLVESGADLEAATLNGATPLMTAIVGSQPGCVDFLLKAGADVTAQNRKEQTCLGVAKAFGDGTIIDLVKEKMASLPEPLEVKKGREPAKTSTTTSKEKIHALPPALLPVVESPERTPGNVSEHTVLYNTRISSGKSNKVDISFIPTTVWPPCSQLIS